MIGQMTCANDELETTTLTAESEGKTYRWTVDAWLEYDLWSVERKGKSLGL